jgi:hypothetical protein
MKKNTVSILKKKKKTPESMIAVKRKSSQGNKHTGSSLYQDKKAVFT